MQATAFLEEQHREVEELLAGLEAGKDAGRLLRDLANHLAAHMAIEQNIFYPAAHECDPDLVEESFEEHALVEVALKRLLRTLPSDPQFAARLSILKELIQRHVDEEEDELFLHVARVMSADALEALGARLERAFAEAHEEGFDSLVPGSLARTSADEALRFIASDGVDGLGPRVAPYP